MPLSGSTTSEDKDVLEPPHIVSIALMSWRPLQPSTENTT